MKIIHEWKQQAWHPSQTITLLENGSVRIGNNDNDNDTLLTQRETALANIIKRLYAQSILLKEELKKLENTPLTSST